jgi:murein DD-endopeptidase MepM/ murein hydrolase activator NlpD
MRNLHRSAKPSYLAGALTLLLLAGLTPAAQAQSLRSRLNNLLGKKERMYDRIRAVKKEQSAATDRLWEAQRKLRATESRLATARTQLRQTSADLEKARAELARLEKRMEQHQEDVQAHLVALYKSGQPGYLNVVMQAESFSDLTNRGRFVTVIVNQDEYLLQLLEERQQEADRKRAALAEKEARQKALVAQIARDEAEARQKQAEVKSILHEANTKRAAAEAMLAAMEQEENQVRAMIRARSRGSSGGGYSGQYSGTWSGSLLRPASGRISSSFGMRVHPITGRYKLHTGVDIAAPSGAPIRAADKGLVISTGWMSAYGQTVVVDHGSGMHTWYCHCSSISVSEGQQVSRGQVIARVGSTGMSTGPHLHFSVLKNGDFVNPLGF